MCDADITTFVDSLDLYHRDLMSFGADRPCTLLSRLYDF